MKTNDHRFHDLGEPTVAAQQVAERNSAEDTEWKANGQAAQCSAQVGQISPVENISFKRRVICIGLLTTQTSNHRPETHSHRASTPPSKITRRKNTLKYPMTVKNRLCQ